MDWKWDEQEMGRVKSPGIRQVKKMMHAFYFSILLLMTEYYTIIFKICWDTCSFRSSVDMRIITNIYIPLPSQCYLPNQKSPPLDQQKFLFTFDFKKAPFKDCFKTCCLSTQELCCILNYTEWRPLWTSLPPLDKNWCHYKNNIEV